MNTATPSQRRGCKGYGEVGLLAMLVPTDLGFLWEERERGRWTAVGWYRTLRGAKMAASRYWGERLEWKC